PASRGTSDTSAGVAAIADFFYPDRPAARRLAARTAAHAIVARRADRCSGLIVVPAGAVRSADGIPSASAVMARAGFAPAPPVLPGWRHHGVSAGWPGYADPAVLPHQKTPPPPAAATIHGEIGT